MIRFELKDKERQAALEKALPGFGEALQRAYECQRDGAATYVSVSADSWVIRIPKEGIRPALSFSVAPALVRACCLVRARDEHSVIVGEWYGNYFPRAGRWMVLLQDCGDPSKKYRVLLDRDERKDFLDYTREEEDAILITAVEKILKEGIADER